jgi:hypothetical protein
MTAVISVTCFSPLDPQAAKERQRINAVTHSRAADVMRMR